MATIKYKNSAGQFVAIPFLTGPTSNLATPRAINGTLFDGTVDIVTAKWGTARTITIGSGVKTVDGSGNVTWSLADIGISNRITPTGGTVNQVLTKNSSTTGDYSWKEIVALPKGGTAGQYLVKNSSTDGDATWQNLPSLNYLPLTGGTVSGHSTFQAGLTIGGGQIELYPSSSAGHGGYIDFHYNGSTADYTSRIIENSSGALICTGTFTATKVYGGVFNDYAEYRETNTLDPGYVMMETGNDTLIKTNERLSHFAGVISDTFGFCEGETEKAKTPIAVAGRVLVYTLKPRESYKPGDCVCAAAGGLVDIMTREEVVKYPDRIVGTVSCVPDYEEWNSSNSEGPIKINNRIWIKVR